MNAPKPPLVVIAGPTASGKSALALALAERTGGAIVNADASQVYADLRVLTARPSAADEARAPHRLYGFVDGAETLSAAAWAGLARAEIEALWAAATLPILVGGSGLYIRTLLDGIAPVPAVDEGVRAAVRALSPAEAHAALAREDGAAAQRLNPADRQRVARALEVVRGTGRPLADWQLESPGGLSAQADVRLAVVEPPRQALYAACDARAATMMEAGALAEVAALGARHLGVDRPVMKALGVDPLVRHLAGDLALPEAVDQLRRDTRHYAKRQSTWFRNQTPMALRIDANKSISASAIDELLLRNMRLT